VTELIAAKIVLTEDQERGMTELLDWWNLPPEHPDYFNCVLSAAAGCGKTFLVKYFTKQLQKAFPLFTATTNEAARQLELTGLKDVRTTHSALGLIPYTGQEATKFIQGQLPECIANCNLLVIDEASMAGKAKDEDSDDLIIDYVFNLGMRTLWLGDEYQLPPVESDNGISPIFEQNLRTVKLHKVVRNKGAILDFCTLLRGSIDSPVKRLPRVPSEIRSITTPNFYRWMDNPEFLEKVLNGELRIINWRNTVADAINAKIRQSIFGKQLADTEAYLPTDQILFTKPLMVGIFPEDTTKLVGNKQIKQGASVNSKAEVLRVSKESLYQIPCYKCKVRIEAGTEEVAWIPTKEGQALLVKLKTKVSKALEGKSGSVKRTQWEQWHAFAGVFSSVKHSYAITTHRAQGATIPMVIVNVVDILSGANRSPLLAYKMLYTGCSRASESLTLIRG
jgi:hypothetical protein